MPDDEELTPDGAPARDTAAVLDANPVVEASPADGSTVPSEEPARSSTRDDDVGVFLVWPRGESDDDMRELAPAPRPGNGAAREPSMAAWTSALRGVFDRFEAALGSFNTRFDMMVTANETTLRRLSEDLGRLTERLDEVAANAAAAPPLPSVDAAEVLAVLVRFSGVQRSLGEQLTGLSRRLDELSAEVSALSPGEQLADVSGRLDQLTAQVSALAPGEELAGVSRRLDELAADVASLSSGEQLADVSRRLDQLTAQVSALSPANDPAGASRELREPGAEVDAEVSRRLDELTSEIRALADLAAAPAPARPAAVDREDLAGITRELDAVRVELASLRRRLPVRAAARLEPGIE